ncbi:MAG: hypothetical protein GF311_20600 [Candidatus Lokiarchaeota archaeon]|nr:hypothetical protein [Candidatus Lokiarchaeota archaeon]
MKDNPKIDYKAIGKEISKFFQRKRFTSSYKPMLFQSILINIKKNKVIESDGCYLISVDDLAKNFLKFNFILFKRFKLKQLNRAKQSVKIYSIIEKFYSDVDYKKLKSKHISNKIIEKVKTLFYRHVIFLLRKDMPIYDFYNKDKKLIPLKLKIKDEQEFKNLIKIDEVGFIGFTPIILDYIRYHFPVLEKANLGVCTEFLEGFNTVPKLFTKLLVAAESFRFLRNISKKYKLKLYEYQDEKCFYCGQKFGESPHADHFIPYNYLFESPIWNIVGSCSDCNLRKSDYLVNSDYLGKLQERNRDSKFQEKFSKLLEKYLGGDIEMINKELEQHYHNCSIYFEFIPNFPNLI